jgi:thymidylate synthase (FAD)
VLGIERKMSLEYPTDLINDVHFQVELDKFGSSPEPEKAIYLEQNICVNEDAREFQKKVENLSPEECGNRIIKHQLGVSHWSVLNFATATVRCFGFPHSVVAQITRHRDSAFLVQSQRYTGKRFAEFEAAIGNSHYFSKVEDLVYLRPVGDYRDRDGNVCNYTQDLRNQDLFDARDNILEYQTRVLKNNQPYEMARGLLPYDFRQDFTITGTIENYFHWLDQRTKKDSQLEIRTLAYMVLDELEKWSPTLFGWYRKNRAGKARLAP